MSSVPAASPSASTDDVAISIDAQASPPSSPRLSKRRSFVSSLLGQLHAPDGQAETAKAPPDATTVRAAPASPGSSPSKRGTPLRILVASWNMGNAMPPRTPKGLEAWVPQGGGGYDVIAVGLQESSYRERSNSEGGGSGGSERDGSRKSMRKISVETSDGGSVQEAGQTVMEEEAVEQDEGEGQVGEEEEEEGDGEIDWDGQEDDEEVEPVAPVDGSGGHDHVIVKKARAKRQMRKVTRLMRQMSSNLRESMTEALDYPFARQLVGHVGDGYALVGRAELMEMRLFVFVLQRHSVSGLERGSVATGLGSVIGNKGGLLVKLVVRNTSLCFISCHLAAHQDQKFLDKRNSDCASILSGAGLGLKHVQPDLQFDHCFWFGDLNYRVDLDMHQAAGKSQSHSHSHSHDQSQNQETGPTNQPRDGRTHEEHVDEVVALVRASDWARLNRCDQLHQQIESERALLGWELPPALFAPTFKRQRDSLDRFNRQRVPSYCDRVLHKSLPGLRAHLKVQSFQSVDTVLTSDHKPVRASFAVAPTPKLTLLPVPAPSSPPSPTSLGSVSPSAAVSTDIDTVTTTTIQFKDVAASGLTGMDITGLSDPYIKFKAVPELALQRDNANGGSGFPCTTTIPNTLSPVWPDAQVPTLSLLCASAADVRRVHLVLCLMDHDATSADDLLGVVTLSLAKFCPSPSDTTSEPRFVALDEPVVRHGRPAGRLVARIRVLLPHQQQPAQQQPHGTGGAHATKRLVAGCHCAIS